MVRMNIAPIGIRTMLAGGAAILARNTLIGFAVSVLRGVWKCLQTALYVTWCWHLADKVV